MLGGKGFLRLPSLLLNWNKGPSGNTTFGEKYHCSYIVLCKGNPVRWARLLLFCLVFSGPLLTSQRAGCTQKLKRAAVIWPLGAGTFFPLTTANSRKRGKTKSSYDAMPFTTSSLKLKILGNLRKSQLALLFWRFDGLHHNIVLLAFSSGPQKIWLVLVLYCTLWVLDSSQTHIFTCSLLLTGWKQ